MALRKKVPLLIAIPTIVITLFASAISYFKAAEALRFQRDTAFDYLIEERVGRLEEWLGVVETDVRVLGAGRAVQEAIAQFTLSWNDLGPEANDWLKKHYITDNPNPTGQKDLLQSAEDGSLWSDDHARYHKGFRTFQLDRGYYDLFLFDTNGNLIYSVFKEADFATNFQNGEYADSGLGVVFQGANSAVQDQIVFSEMSPYAPSAGAPAQFAAMPIFDDAGTRIGVVALQIPVDARVSAILSESALLGETGIVFAVDADGRALSSSPRDGGFEMFDQLPDLPHIAEARNGNVVSEEGNIGLSGAAVVARAMPLVRAGRDWNVVLEQDVTEAYAKQNALLLFTLAQVFFTVILVSVIAYLVARALTGRIGSLASSVKKIAQGDFETVVDQASTQDELGEIGQSLENFKIDLEQGNTVMVEREAQAKEQAKAMERLGLALQELAGGDLDSHIQEPLAPEYEEIRSDFNRTVAALAMLVGELRGSVEAIDQSSVSLSNNAESLAQRTENQAAALEETAAAMDQITSSVQSAAEGAENVVNAVELASSHANHGNSVRLRTVEAMGAIEASANQIGKIIQVMEDIAFQTNLLALNAGVEAARAGDAGSGFAVVAAEVLKLAHRSSDSASEIRDLIANSNENVSNGARMVTEMGEAIDKIMNEVLQAAEMSRGIAAGSSQQATGLSEINSGITMLDQVTQQNAAMVTETAESLRDMRKKAAQLQSLVSRFKNSSGVELDGSQNNPKSGHSANLDDHGSGGQDTAEWQVEPSPSSRQNIAAASNNQEWKAL